MRHSVIHILCVVLLYLYIYLVSSYTYVVPPVLDGTSHRFTMHACIHELPILIGTPIYMYVILSISFDTPYIALKFPKSLLDTPCVKSQKPVICWSLHGFPTAFVAKIGVNT